MAIFGIKNRLQVFVMFVLLSFICLQYCFCKRQFFFLFRHRTQLQIMSIKNIFNIFLQYFYGIPSLYNLFVVQDYIHCILRIKDMFYNFGYLSRIDIIYRKLINFQAIVLIKMISNNFFEYRSRFILSTKHRRSTSRSLQYGQTSSFCLAWQQDQ